MTLCVFSTPLFAEASLSPLPASPVAPPEFKTPERTAGKFIGGAAIASGTAGIQDAGRRAGKFVAGGVTRRTAQIGNGGVGAGQGVAAAVAGRASPIQRRDIVPRLSVPVLLFPVGLSVFKAATLLSASLLPDEELPVVLPRLATPAFVAPMVCPRRCCRSGLRY